MSNENLILKFASKSKRDIFSIVETFCQKHGLDGVDGLNGQLSFVKALVREGRVREEPGLVRDLFEIAFSIWALGQLNYSHIADEIAKKLNIGGTYGETDAYLMSSGGNYFKNFLLQLQVGLRLIEHGIHIVSGNEKTGDPDYIIESENLVLEVKAPASRLALYQALIKGVQQIEATGTPGIIIVSLDHMVARKMINVIEDSLPTEIIDIILSSLPTKPHFNTIGVIAEWCNWTGNEAYTTVQPVMNTIKGSIVDNKNKIRIIWQALSVEDVSSNMILEKDSPYSFPYSDNCEPLTNERIFFSETWPEL